MNIIKTSHVKDMKQNGTSLCVFHFQISIKLFLDAEEY